MENLRFEVFSCVDLSNDFSDFSDELSILVRRLKLLRHERLSLKNNYCYIT